MRAAAHQQLICREGSGAPTNHPTTAYTNTHITNTSTTTPRLREVTWTWQPQGSQDRGPKLPEGQPPPPTTTNTLDENLARPDSLIGFQARGQVPSKGTFWYKAASSPGTNRHDNNISSSYNSRTLPPPPASKLTADQTHFSHSRISQMVLL